MFSYELNEVKNEAKTNLIDENQFDINSISNITYTDCNFSGESVTISSSVGGLLPYISGSSELFIISSFTKQWAQSVASNPNYHEYAAGLSARI